MKTDFICPKCNGHLLVGEKIILVAVSRKEKKTGIILLSPEVGNHARIIHPTFILEKGEETDIFCPICHCNLMSSDTDGQLVKIFMVDDKDDKYEIYFSGVFGEYCTYKISENKVEQFGDSAEKYYKYFIGRKI
ncbi:MAG: hypothetical protein A2W99_11630 [Bacteroidetes bacterium GWF2_33_16]|nr:MAG: hypothetical protein A2X00_02645 [Bacteroidetes bacterium GWE2_32_14]OFY06352.1 MAG: hypothetical protein A2W99_11630 [Bacteroidetes bacterium GWF2_33_16]